MRKEKTKVSANASRGGGDLFFFSRAREMRFTASSKNTHCKERLDKNVTSYENKRNRENRLTFQFLCQGRSTNVNEPEMPDWNKFEDMPFPLDTVNRDMVKTTGKCGKIK